MKKVQHIETINEYNLIAQHQTLHPLVSIIDFSKLKLPSKSNHEKPDVQAEGERKLNEACQKNTKAKEKYDQLIQNTQQ